jgi:hypothetical protein
MYYLEECGEVDNGRKRLILYIFSLPTLVKNPSCCRVEGFGSISSFTKRVYICMFLCFADLCVCPPPVVEYNFCFSVSGLRSSSMLGFVCLPSGGKCVAAVGVVMRNLAATEEKKRRERTPGQSEMMMM